jgi:hypothetical protein
LNLLIAEVAYAISNLPKTIIQMQQPTSGWYSYPSLMGVLMGLNSLPKRPSNFGMMYDDLNVGL